MEREAILRMRSGKFCSYPLLLAFLAATVSLAGGSRGQDLNSMGSTGLDSSGQSGSTTDSTSGGDMSGQILGGGRGLQQSSVPRGVMLPNGPDNNASGMN